ncbi:hypothetical protein M0802_010366 [Mischocyttarus mexicanus]|nr:hypothetical protein M0802_010366 [Mischocyttarus mexicanus]
MGASWCRRLKGRRVGSWRGNEEVEEEKVEEEEEEKRVGRSTLVQEAKTGWKKGSKRVEGLRGGGGGGGGGGCDDDGGDGGGGDGADGRDGYAKGGAWMCNNNLPSCKLRSCQAQHPLDRK